MFLNLQFLRISAVQFSLKHIFKKFQKYLCFSLQECLHSCSFLYIDRSKIKEKMYIQNFLLMKSSKKYFIFSSACNLIIWLMISPKNLKKKAFWKYDSWFSSEVSKLTSVGNKTNLSLKYWFFEAKVVIWIWYGPQKLSKYQVDTIETTFWKDKDY